ncbi:sensor domain-containing protein [Chloroflexota bacterium]
MTANSINAYLMQLRAELKGSDTALVQDALADSEEHLRSALEILLETQPNLPNAEAMDAIIAEYGTPDEIAEAYREVESYTRPALAPRKQKARGNIFSRFFGVYLDPQAWGSLVYLLISILTGTLYFSWAFVGLSTSLVFALFIFGLPLAAFFMISIRGVALVEGRLIEALLGVRMPRRTIFSPANMNWLQRLKAQLLDKQTWLILFYLILQGLLGTVYFIVYVTLIAFALLFLAMPVFTSLGLPIITLGDQLIHAPLELLPVSVLFGFLLLTTTMHIAKFNGKIHARYAKFMLVGE